MNRQISEMAGMIAGMTAALASGNPAVGVGASSFVKAIHDYKEAKTTEDELAMLKNVATYLKSVMANSLSYLTDANIANVMNICQAEQLKSVIATVSNDSADEPAKIKARAVFASQPVHQDLFKTLLGKLTSPELISSAKTAYNQRPESINEAGSGVLGVIGVIAACMVGVTAIYGVSKRND